MKRRLTVAQAIVAFLSQQYSKRDARENKFYAGCFGIFGHGNVAGMGQALEQDHSLRYRVKTNVYFPRGRTLAGEGFRGRLLHSLGAGKNCWKEAG